MQEFMKLNVSINMLIKTVKIWGIKNKDCECCLEYTNVKNRITEQNKSTCVAKKLSKKF